MKQKYTCPCCGYKTFEEQPGSFDICPVCYWEDELMQLRYPLEKGANRFSLIEAQLNYEKNKVSDMELKIFAREPLMDEEKDKNWRKIDLKKDKIVEKDKTKTERIYPIDTTKLYYWEKNYLDKE